MLNLPVYFSVQYAIGEDGHRRTSIKLTIQAIYVTRCCSILSKGNLRIFPDPFPMYVTIVIFNAGILGMS